jgi:hypothetical protein
MDAKNILYIIFNILFLKRDLNSPLPPRAGKIFRLVFRVFDTLEREG